MPATDPEIIGGSDVALEMLQVLNYRSTLRTATIVSYNMQDYDFWGHGALSHLLLRQLSLGAAIKVMTTPPPGKGTAFMEKYGLLSLLDKNGVRVVLNEKLHAKAYLFLDENGSSTTIVGSPNLTGPGFGLRITPDDSLLEMAVITSNPAVFAKAERFVGDSLLNHKRTKSFATWFSRNAANLPTTGAI